ncbi:hypothetical protein [Chryseobacterium sp. R2ACT005]|uniref:hypothetical protein n=1 Tax=Chryseobacterium sp. R2ACT005 TaxID=3416668 RepID=UPI003CED5E80
MEKQLEKIRNNQIILDKKLEQILNELDFVKKELKIVINNQLKLEDYDIDLKSKIQHLEKSVLENKLNK